MDYQFIIISCGLRSSLQKFKNLFFFFFFFFFCRFEAVKWTITSELVYLDWLVGCLGLTAIYESILVYIEPFLREREIEERYDRWEKMYKQPTSASSCPTITLLLLLCFYFTSTVNI